MVHRRHERFQPVCDDHQQFFGNIYKHIWKFFLGFKKPKSYVLCSKKKLYFFTSYVRFGILPGYSQPQNRRTGDFFGFQNHPYGSVFYNNFCLAGGQYVGLDHGVWEQEHAFRHKRLHSFPVRQ